MAEYLEISQPQYDSVVAQAQSASPLEACGLMAGDENRVRQVYPVDNIRHSPVEYEMDPQQQLRAMLDMEDKGWELTAIYHSHPNGPQVPSATDVERALYPDAVYVIISLAQEGQPTLRAFHIVSRVVAEIPLRVV